MDLRQWMPLPMVRSKRAIPADAVVDVCAAALVLVPPAPMPLNPRSTEFSEKLVNTPQSLLLASGGDSRMVIEAETGLNKYGCATEARSAVALGSCTASSPSPTGMRASGQTHERLRRAARDGDEALVDEVDVLFETYRSRLRKVLKLDSVECEVAFCPSGTDAEILALALARAGRPGLFLNVVTGPSEVGSGTKRAAGARHFNTHVPAGASRTPGDPIDDVLSEGVRVETIKLRSHDGRLHPPAELDERADVLVRGACREGARVLLHVVAHSKTGVYAPTFDKVAELRDEFGDQVAVILDAAQGRLSRRSIKAALELGYMVLITGSKFYGGPAFSGAVLVPPAYAPAATGLQSLSAGLRDYMTASELPTDWESLRASLPAEPNFGLVLRWSAALAQIEAYYRVPSDQRLAVMRAFEETVPDVLGDSKLIDVVAVSPLRERDSPRFLEAATTVFPFFVREEPGGEYLRKAGLKKVFRQLNEDLSGTIESPDAGSKAVLARQIHIGQPVLLSGDARAERSVLRIALGAPLVVTIASDTRVGKTFPDRIEWMRAQIAILRAKIELIALHD